MKVPHMGWNYLRIKRPSELIHNLPDNPRFYFVHSYHVVCKNDNIIIASTDYGYEFASVIMKDNIIGAQFHPEKSHKFGMKFLTNFVERF
jgi:glutamine amidotransferase